MAAFTDLSVGDLDPDKPLCDAIKAVFEARGIGGFEKLRPARQLQLRLQLGEKEPDADSLEAFADLFDRLNNKLA